MVIHKNMSNFDIYNLATALVDNFQGDLLTASLPVKVNFYMQKNLNTLVDAAKEIEKTRSDIISKYGSPIDGAAEMHVPEDKVEIANKELEELFALEQDIAVYMINLDMFEGINMNSKQVAALMFMIEEE